MLTFTPEILEHDTALASAAEAVRDEISQLERDTIAAILSAIRFCGYAKEDIEVRSENTHLSEQSLYRREYWSRSENRMLAAYWQSAAVNDARLILTRDLSPLKERYEQALGARQQSPDSPYGATPQEVRAGRAGQSGTRTPKGEPDPRVQPPPQPRTPPK